MTHALATRAGRAQLHSSQPLLSAAPLPSAALVHSRAAGLYLAALVLLSVTEGPDPAAGSG